VEIALRGVFSPALAKRTKHLSFVDILSVGVDRMQRNFEPLRNRLRLRRQRGEAQALTI
jgi:hypothetical protein